jgi:hypothetical protein
MLSTGNDPANAAKKKLTILLQKTNDKDETQSSFL